MPSELSLPLSWLLGFLLVLTRVAGIFTFLPLPGARDAPDAAKILLSLAVTISLSSRWPLVPEASRNIGALLGLLLAEAVFGVAIGLIAAFLLEAMTVGAQVAGLPAGFGFVNTIDPASQSDTGILLTFAQLFSGLLFFSFGLHREFIRAIAASLGAHPPGAAWITPQLGLSVARLGAAMFTTGFRLALPALALLLLVDLALALAGRLNAHLQLLTLALPPKLLGILALTASLTYISARVFENNAAVSLHAIQVLVR